MSELTIIVRSNDNSDESDWDVIVKTKNVHCAECASAMCVIAITELIDLKEIADNYEEPKH